MSEGPEHTPADLHVTDLPPPFLPRSVEISCDGTGTYVPNVPRDQIPPMNWEEVEKRRIMQNTETSTNRYTRHANEATTQRRSWTRSRIPAPDRDSFQLGPAPGSTRPAAKYRNVTAKQSVVGGPTALAHSAVPAHQAAPAGGRPGEARADAARVEA